MSTRTLLKQIARLELLATARRQDPILESLRQDPTQILSLAGLTPDAWQQQLLRSAANRMLLLCARQSGKSTVAAAMALRVALLRPRSPVLLLSPTLRQSGELFRKILFLFNQMGRPVGVRAESALRLELVNGSRIVSLPGTEGTVRGFSEVALLIIDEAARVADSLYYSVRPMLAVSQGSFLALSTPFGKRGWFHDEWHGDNVWERVKIKAEECARIPPEFLAGERKALGERWYKQEYCCDFSETINAVFNYEDIQAAFDNDLKPLFTEGIWTT